MSFDETMKRAAAFFAAATVCALVNTEAHATIPVSAFAETYQPVPAVAANQSQVVYYRGGTTGQQASAANVYVDGEFHASLLPGAFTVLCVASGVHGLNSALNDAPRYEGKGAQPRTSLEGGKTYFLKLSENGTLLPKAVSRMDAEKELANSRRQVHLLSRASIVVECNYTASVMAQEHTSSGDVALALGKTGYSALRADGRDVLRMDSEFLDPVDRINSIDHDASNRAQGMVRADVGEGAR
ncbi:hypothetical protein [uncultured Stenotrophomonas sp.]|uniref:hypothetical protein n=1 Tax=uncultured Stenotrophomonas sp. TaxID=165438 RepID=UPI0025DF714C|nr:hypothetical protein [uncultured Stenotrophomonas sp.]